MTDFNQGDRVMVDADGDGDYSGLGTVTHVYSNGWVAVRSDTAWDEHTTVFDFEPERVTKYEYISPQPGPARHPNSARFHMLLQELAQLHDRKQQDYGRDEDPFANVRAAEEWGVSPWIGAMVRATDKVRRLQSLITNGKLENESAEDSLRDLAVYAVIALVLFEEERAA